jgi:hypothetical protein
MRNYTVNYLARDSRGLYQSYLNIQARNEKSAKDKFFELCRRVNGTGLFNTAFEIIDIVLEEK